MKISIDRRVKMVPIMEISSGDEVNIGGFDYVVENILPCRKGSYDAHGIRLVMSSYKHGQLVRKVDSVFSIDSILVFLPKGDSVVVESLIENLKNVFLKYNYNDGRREM